MTLETQVQALTVDTESLLQSVNTRKADLEQDCPWVGSLDKTHNWEWVCNGKPDPETGQMTGPDYTVVFDNES